MPKQDNVVRWEKPGYEFTPTGLMAEDWGKTGHRTELEPFLQENWLTMRRIMDNDSARDSAEYIRSLDDATLLAALETGSSVGAEIARRLVNGEDTWINPSWVISHVATLAYERGLIDETQIDRILQDS